MKAAALAFAAVTWVANATPPVPNSDRAEIAALEQYWLATVRSGDHRALANILADGFTDINVNGEMRDRAEAIAHAVTPPDTTQTIIRLNVRVLGDAAIATGINSVHSRSQGWTAEVAFTDVFVREHGSWRAVSAQETLRKPTSATPSH